MASRLHEATRRRGFPASRALVWALVLLLFAGALGAALLDRGRAVDLATKNDLVSLQSLYAADGGLALARRRLCADPAYAGGSARVGDRDVKVVVERRGSGWLVRSRSGGTTVEATLRGGSGLPAVESYAQVSR